MEDQTAPLAPEYDQVAVARLCIDVMHDPLLSEHHDDANHILGKSLALLGADQERGA